MGMIGGALEAHPGNADVKPEDESSGAETSAGHWERLDVLEKKFNDYLAKLENTPGARLEFWGGKLKVQLEEWMLKYPAYKDYRLFYVLSLTNPNPKRTCQYFDFPGGEMEAFIESLGE